MNDIRNNVIVSIIGSGLMGHGIALDFALSGFKVYLNDVSKEKMQILHDDNRLVYNGKGVPRIKRYVDEMDGIPITDLWTDICRSKVLRKLTMLLKNL